MAETILTMFFFSRKHESCFFLFKFVELFIEITPPIIKIDCGANFWKDVSAINFLLGDNTVIQ